MKNEDLAVRFVEGSRAASEARARGERDVERSAQAEIDSIVETTRRMPTADLSSFLTTAFRLMNDAVSNLHGPTNETSLYRAFDAMDEILGLDYQRDVGMRVDPTQSERLYEGAGLGVQSSYASILAVLQNLEPRSGAHLVDLGSGYGRVGFIVGFLRPDMEFTGYEYVPHRIEVSRDVASRVGLGKKIRFHTQDLARADFRIPDAEIYYLYDPFSRETYGHVFSQLKEIARRKQIAVAIKGNGRMWFSEAVSGDPAWIEPRLVDEQTVTIFESRAP